jgi:hypothetical protein
MFMLGIELRKAVAKQLGVVLAMLKVSPSANTLDARSINVPHEVEFGTAKLKGWYRHPFTS